MSQERRLGVVVGVNAAMVVALVLVGLFAHSLGVLASGADYLGDGAGAALSLLAARMRRRRRGRPQLTSYAALTNASLLLAATAAVAVDAVYRLGSGAPAIDGVPVIVVSVIAASAMIACAAVLGDVSGDLSMESVLLDTVADAAAATCVRGSALARQRSRRAATAAEHPGLGGRRTPHGASMSGPRARRAAVGN